MQYNFNFNFLRRDTLRNIILTAQSLLSIMSCSGCGKAFTSSFVDIVSCNYCNDQFHYDCSGIDRAAINSIKKFSNICYLCNCCKVLLKNNDFSKLIRKIDVVADKAMDAIDLKKLELDVAENKKIINMLKEKLVDTSSNQSLPNVIDTNASSSYLSFPNPIQGIVGTGESVISIKPANIQERKQLYVSRIDPSVSSTSIVDYICSKLSDCSPDDIDCKLLLSKARVIDSSLTFVSFRIGINDMHFDKLNDPSMWPVGVIIRPFMNHPRKPKNWIGITPQQSVI